MADSTSAGEKLVPDDLLEVLACPACHGDIAIAGDRLVCQSCGRRYRVDNGIPIMLVDEAELPEQEPSA